MYYKLNLSVSVHRRDWNGLRFDMERQVFCADDKLPVEVGSNINISWAAAIFRNGNV
jgi:hypothetical protein